MLCTKKTTTAVGCVIEYISNPDTLVPLNLTQLIHFPGEFNEFYATPTALRHGRPCPSYF